MEKKTVTIALVQINKDVESKLTFTAELGTEKLSEVAGTIAYRVTKLRQRATQYKMNLNGFSFGRKFDVHLTIDGEQTTGTQTIANGSVRFGITLQDKAESIEKFGGFIAELVTDILTGRNELIVDLPELLVEISEN